MRWKEAISSRPVVILPSLWAPTEGNLLEHVCVVGVAGLHWKYCLPVWGCPVAELAVQYLSEEDTQAYSNH